MRDTGKQKRVFHPKSFDQLASLHYREDSDSVIFHDCTPADNGYKVTISSRLILMLRMSPFVILCHYKISEMAKSLELLGARPSGPAG